jgi:hypothetical protein
MNVEIGTEAVQFPEKGSINGIFVAVWIMMYKGTLTTSGGHKELSSVWADQKRSRI